MPEHGEDLTTAALVGQREIIDSIDAQLIELLSARAQASLAVAAIKSAAGLEIYVQSREDEVIKRVHALNAGPYTNMQLTKLFLCIMGESRQLQSQYMQHANHTDSLTTEAH